MDQTNRLSSPFRVIPLARLANGGRWRTEAMRSYGAPVLLWFTRGQGRITVNGKTAGYTAHNAIFIPAGTMHGFEMNSSVQGMIVVFPVGVERQLELPEDTVHMRLPESEQHIELNRLIDNLQTELEGGNLASDRAMLCHAGLLSVWVERQMRSLDIEEPDADASSRLAAAYTALVEQDFHSAKTVRDYAKDLGVTPTHLSRVCNKACGRPASSILADRVHYEARRLLTETHMPIKDIASSLGFASAAYFTRAFQQHTGRTPSQFRRGG
ncbi:AraC family transcriptional regulator [Maritimibacter sp. DP1N21-5]|uniref:AraC family transcriptional regulator n=1 Tax=Maritimibacter sp. DP1N21-5 TaxID=2836867 RepID=UPI001C4902B2|nr:AraC family transcriptional regulator [Maritimibacter sp. DP1N21-5]MBV7409783.1 AraC family transcriptional regulator [Maritimibacter sp. DP1N21-5]